MNILFLGRFYPAKLLKTIQTDTRGKVGFSNHNFEMSLIEGFATLPEVNLRVVTALWHSPFRTTTGGHG